MTPDGEVTLGCGVPPNVVVYVPLARSETDFALIEAETAGVVMEPGAEVAERNTRLQAIVEQVFTEIAEKKAQGELVTLAADGAVLWSAPLSTSTNGATYFAKVMVDDARRITVAGTGFIITRRPGEVVMRDTMLVLRFDQLTPRLFGTPASDSTGFDGVAVGPLGGPATSPRPLICCNGLRLPR